MSVGICVNKLCNTRSFVAKPGDLICSKPLQKVNELVVYVDFETKPAPKIAFDRQTQQQSSCSNFFQTSSTNLQLFSAS